MRTFPAVEFPDETVIQADEIDNDVSEYDLAIQLETPERVAKVG